MQRFHKGGPKCVLSNSTLVVPANSLYPSGIANENNRSIETVNFSVAANFRRRFWPFGCKTRRLSSPVVIARKKIRCVLYRFANHGQRASAETLPRVLLSFFFYFLQDDEKYCPSMHKEVYYKGKLIAGFIRLPRFIYSFNSARRGGARRFLLRAHLDYPLAGLPPAGLSPPDRGVSGHVSIIYTRPPPPTHTHTHTVFPADPAVVLAVSVRITTVRFCFSANDWKPH